MKRGTPRHPKIFALCSLLKVKRPTAIGYLEMLWHMTAEYTPQGDVGKYSDQWIEAALDWTGKKGHLIDCLVQAGWLDREPATAAEPVGNGEATARQWPGNRKLMVHDWHDHADAAVSKRLERLHLPFLTVREKVTGQNLVTDQLSAASRARDPASALPEPEPEPASQPPTCLTEADRLAGLLIERWPHIQGRPGAKLLAQVAEALGDIPIERYGELLVACRSKAKSFGLALDLAWELRKRWDAEAAQREQAADAETQRQIARLENLLADASVPQEERPELERYLRQLRAGKGAA